MKNERYKDTDLREALRRKYADTPQLPAGFMNNMERKTNPPMTRPVRRWWWVAAAASVLLIIGIGVTMMPIEERMPTAPKVVAKMEPQQTSVVTTQEEPREEKIVISQKNNQNKLHDSKQNQKTVPVIPTVEPEDDHHLHYASAELTKDTLPYQNPARVDEFIAYLLSFSHQQFFFELKDMRQQLQYRWIAERVNGKILLYGTHAPLGTKESSACYQDYRDELMHTKSINKTPREI